MRIFKHSFLLNPKRIEQRSIRQRVKMFLLYFPIRFGLFCGFTNIEYSYVHGEKSRVVIGPNCSTMNTIFNVISGTITIGHDTSFAHGCMVLTGIHNFFEGIRGDLHNPPIPETPCAGRDILIGAGCFIGSGAIILGNVTIGDNAIIGAGAVVTKDIPANCVAGGVPAVVLKMNGYS